MFRKLIFFFLLNLIITNPLKALEVTNVEWSSLSTIFVTVYDPEITDLTTANCTAFYIPEDNKPIGGGRNFYEAGIAQISISVPKSFRKKDIKNFKITCKNRK
jgi:hypothetical protein